MQQIISNLIPIWQLSWQTGKRLTKQVQRTFYVCKIRLSKSSTQLGAWAVLGSSTHELTDASVWAVLLTSEAWGQPVLNRFVPEEVSPGSPASWEVQLGKAKREGCPEGGRTGTGSSRGAPCPWALSSHTVATTPATPSSLSPARGTSLLHLDMYTGFSCPVRNQT